jgi:hypothetical protein
MSGHFAGLVLAAYRRGLGFASEPMPDSFPVWLAHKGGHPKKPVILAEATGSGHEEWWRTFGGMS